MISYEVCPIGKIINNEKGTFIKLEKKYIPGLIGMNGFSHINVIWWFSDFDEKEFRSILENIKPYKSSPEVMGTFATRSPIRPNPIAVTTVEVININYEEGVIEIAFIDANNNTPVLDIKPYTASLDRVESPKVPKWCSHWPKSIEESETFPWENEFNF